MAGNYLARSNLPLGMPRIIGQREEAIVADTMNVFAEAQLYRNTSATMWEEIASLILPWYRNTFMYGNYNWPGQKKTELQIDSTGAMALSRFAAICDSLLTPRNQMWHQLQADDDYVQKDRQTQLYFEQVTKILFKQRYAAHANFSSQNQGVYQSLGAFGTGQMYPDKFYSLTGERGLRYRAPPLGEMFYIENYQGQIDAYVRWFRRTARQTMQQWGQDWFPAALVSALEGNSQTQFNFLQYVCPRTDYDPEAIDARSLPWRSVYISIEGQCMMEPESGYNIFPIAPSRYEQAPGEIYGRGPASIVLPSLKTLNAQKRTFLKQGHRAADPVLLTSDDGVVGMSLRPGAVNKGGMSANGKRLVDVLPTGNIQINKEMMEEEKALINDAFLVTLFQILTETPQMTATEVIERTNEKGILIAPTMGRQMSEYLGPMVDRELDLLAQLNLLPPMPPRLKEAKGHYHTTYASPLTRAMRAGAVAGFNRAVENVKELVAITGDRKLLSPFNFDVAIPEMAEIDGVQPSWMNDQDTIQKLNDGIDQQIAKQQQIQAAPAAAALVKAQAAQQQQGQAPDQGQPQTIGG